MNAIIARANEIRKEAAAKFGGLPGDYSMKIACEMAKNGESVQAHKTTVALNYIGDNGLKVALVVSHTGIDTCNIVSKMYGPLVVSNPSMSGMYLAGDVVIGGEVKRLGNKIDRDDLRRYIAARQLATDLFNAANPKISTGKTPETLIPGLSTLRTAIDTWAGEHRKMARAIDNGSSICPARTLTGADLDGLKAQYPEAAAYIKAEGYTNARDDRKSTAGDKAMRILVDGGKAAQALEVLNNWC